LILDAPFFYGVLIYAFVVFSLELVVVPTVEVEAEKMFLS
jgi:hypothetical protein